MENTKYNILIATGIYPPEIGGPAEYAKNLADVWTKEGHMVSVKIFSQFRKYPWGVRHIIFFFYVLPSVLRADYIVTLEAFSAGIVTVASKLFFKKVVFRTGGDFLWEIYVERTGDKVLLKDFYKTRLGTLSFKEKMVFSLMRWTLRNISGIIWSTEWQKNIFMEPYGLEKQKHFIIENYYGPKEGDVLSESKVFVGSGRNIILKNNEILEKVFQLIAHDTSDVSLFLNTLPFHQFMEKIKASYAVINISVSEISPNLILDAIRYNKPFICTREVGIYERIKDVGVYVNPLDEEEIKKAALYLLNEENYQKEKEKIKQFNFTHSWQEIGREFVHTFNSLQK